MSPSRSAGPGAPAGSGGELGSVIDALTDAGAVPVRARAHGRHSFPSRERIIDAVEALRSVLFPGYFGTTELSGDSVRFHLGATLDGVRHVLHEQIRRGLWVTAAGDGPEAMSACDARAAGLAHAFLERLPHVRRLLGSDLEAAFEGDPAATSRDEVLLAYPGLQAITNQRLAHELWLLGVPLIPRIITELAHSVTGIDIHPGARIGERFFIDHGTGVVIGETCVIGKSVRVYQGVTLGAKSFPLDEQGRPLKALPRHPVVEDEVIIYSNATILGRVTIGRGSVIGGNVWLDRTVPPNSSITQVQARAERYGDGGGI